MKIHNFDGIYQERWGFSWAMLVYQRVFCIFLKFSTRFSRLAVWGGGGETVLTVNCDGLKSGCFPRPCQVCKMMKVVAGKYVFGSPSNCSIFIAFQNVHIRRNQTSKNRTHTKTKQTSLIYIPGVSKVPVFSAFKKKSVP